jgi:hypothetical protein
MRLIVGAEQPPMTAGTAQKPFRVLAGLATIGWLAIAAQALWWPDSSHWPARLGALVLGLALVPAMLRGPQPLLLLSPLTGFSFLCPVFYAIIPALTVGPFLSYSRVPVIEAAGRFLDGRGELLVLQFAAMCAGAAALLVLACRNRKDAIGSPWSEHGARHASTGAAALCLLLAAVLAIRYRVPAVAAFMEAGAGRQMLHGIPPLMSASVAVLFFAAAGRGRRRLALALACGLVGAAALISTATSKVSVYMLAAAFVLYCVTSRPRAIALAGAAAAALAVLCAATLYLAEIRSSYFSKDRPETKSMSLGQRIGDALVYKIAARQTETVSCFQRVVEGHLGSPGSGTPFYFLSAVVPRAVWPKKPNLSLGSAYALAYCGYRPQDMPADGSHSLSITLIGQPLMRAGLAGLAVAQIFAIVLLGLVSLGAAGIRVAGPVALAALVPWLVDFDQSFALYVANGAKMFLYMLPVLVGVFWMQRRADGHA